MKALFMDDSELTKLLGASEAFSLAPKSALEALVAAGEVKAIAEGEVLISQGMTGEAIWLLLEGDLEVLVGEQIVNQVSERGEVLGEISAVSLTPATATVRSTKTGKALCIPHKDLNAVIKETPELAASMLRSMAKYMGRM
ncbi:MAG: cyclic nucleotide-binding domain-containing protein [Verrucomicrobiota bacterium]